MGSITFITVNDKARVIVDRDGVASIYNTKKTLTEDEVAEILAEHLQSDEDDEQTGEE